MELALWASLFGSAFLAATVVPFYSEFAVAAAVAAGASPIMVVMVAGAGNTAGACVNWLLGMGIERFRHRRWFPVPERELERAQAWFQRYGVWSLLLAWLPIGGDALTVVAGVMRVRFQLDCDGAPEFIVITIEATPTFTSALTGNETILLRYLNFTLDAAEQTYLRLDVEGSGNLVTLVDADTIEAPAEYGFEHFTAITADSDWCTPVSYFCGTRDRIAARFALGDSETYPALDGQHEQIGPPPGVDVWMQEVYVNVTECDDEPVGKAKLLVVNQAQE